MIFVSVQMDNNETIRRGTNHNRFIQDSSNVSPQAIPYEQKIMKKK